MAQHAERYRGKNLLRLLAAICIPAGLLYLRLVIAVASVQKSVTPQLASWLTAVSMAVLVVFFAVQAFAAWYLVRLLPPQSSAPVKAMRAVGVFLMGLLFSVTGAVMLEAFGYVLFAQLRR